MYNLFISANDEAWSGEPWKTELKRCLREHTDSSLMNRFGELTSDDVNLLRRLPCIFGYESACKKAPMFGCIRDVRVRGNECKIEYELVEVNPFLQASEMEEMSFELAIDKWELNRTHWALKDVDLARELSVKGITLPLWARSQGSAVDIGSHHFQVSLSFPGEERDYVKDVAKELERLLGPHSYFYDNNYIAQLARPQLDSLLQDIYGRRSDLVVVFLCSQYQMKQWCGVEFRTVRQAIMNRDHLRIMFVRMDDGTVDGVFETDGFVDGRKFSAGDVAKFIQERVDLLKRSQ